MKRLQNAKEIGACKSGKGNFNRVSKVDNIPLLTQI